MFIRKAKISDWQIIADFQLALIEETEEFIIERNIVENGVKAVLDDPSRGQYYVTENDKEVIACLMVSFEWSDWRNVYMPWIQSLYVKPEFRRKGIYKRMYLFLQDEVKASKEWAGIRLYVDKSNIVAQKAYESLGMTKEHYFLYEWMK